ncbi:MULTISPECIES: RodZ domain-containing protein [unclassified Halomonas]|uniref:RodZ domain-containing protein n=1 Tax=unclassified Halomonas TaxID=2609666 RepID=UPI00207670E2|nr:MULTISPECIES: RodZ domain-containing protein [unclassified Halomonas]
MSDMHLHENTATTTASPGELLSHQREQLGVALSDAARALNLRPAVVEGLERDQYDEIPVAAYRRGYLRAYAKYLGMDEHLVLDAYKAHFGTAEAESKVAPVTTSRPPSRVGAWLFKLVTLLVIAGLIGVTVMWWQSRGGSEPPSMGAAPTAEEQSQLDAASTDAALPDTPASAPASSDAATGQANGADVNDSAALEATSEPEPVELSETAIDAALALNEAQNQGDANTLELSFAEQSWTEIFDANNQRVFVGLQTPGTTATVEGEPPFRLTIGNATGVTLDYMGESVDLAQRAGANNVARFTLGE